MALGPIMLDIDGTELQPADRRLLVDPAVGGLILFTRNYESPAQVASLVAEVRALRAPPLIVAVDHEGGRVQRFRDGFTSIPAMREIGRYYDRDPDDALLLAETTGWLAGAELRSVGIDLSFSPCVDLDRGLNDAIGNRAFHREPRVVTELAARYCRGLADAGMAAVAKHFPGHGAVVADSHERLPVDRREPGDLMDDVEPFAALIRRRLLGGVMLSHVVYSAVDASPASLSRRWIQGELRERIGFDGAIFTDDMTMKATAEFGSMRRRTRAALDAGADMVIICNDREAAARAVHSLDGYTNPPSLVRLARLHGAAAANNDELQGSDAWHAATDRLNRWMERPVLELDA